MNRQFSTIPLLSVTERNASMDNYFFNRFIRKFPYRKPFEKKKKIKKQEKDQIV